MSDKGSTSLRNRQHRSESSADSIDHEYTQDDEHVESVYQNPVCVFHFFLSFHFLKSTYRETDTELSYS